MLDHTQLNQMFNTEEKYNKIYELIKSNKPREIKYKDFHLNENDRIIYKTKNQILTVIPKWEVEKFLEDLFKNDNNLVGKGITTFYKYICQHYINITRDDVSKFLKNQTNYQLTYDPHHQINRPIIERFSNARYQVDLIDMSNYVSANYSKGYIFNCCDVFSRKIWLRALKNKEAQETAKAIESIFKEAKITPKIIQTDRGGEFTGKFSEICEEYGVKQLFSQSHSPNQNGIVERSNKNLRKILRAFFVKNNTLKWYNILPQVEENINSQYNSSIKNVPNKIWTATNQPIDESEKKIKKDILETQKLTLKRAEEKLDKSKNQDDFKIGQHVRVKLSSIFTNIRKELKQGNSKNLIVTYSPDVFVISNKIYGNRLQRNKYTLETQDGDQLVNVSNKKPHHFYGSEMIHSSPENISHIDTDRALKLNNIDRAGTADVMLK